MRTKLFFFEVLNEKEAIILIYASRGFKFAERKSSAGIALLANVSMPFCSSGHKVSATWCRLRGVGSAFMTCCIPGELGR